MKLDVSENGYYVQRLQWDVSQKRQGRRREDVKRRGLKCACVCVCVSSVPELILICVLQTVEEEHHRLQEALSKFSLERGNFQ